jgi:predicted nucleic acid-binding protein
VALHPVDRLLIERCAFFTEQYGVTFYDAAYAALAENLEAVLVTADTKDHKKIREVRVRVL